MKRLSNYLNNKNFSNYLVPVIDYENDRQNWCRTLNSIHLITSPMTILYITGTYLYIWESWLFIGITAFICIISSLLVFFKTSNKTVPKFHYLFGFLGFAVSMLWIYAFATETVNFGFIFKWIRANHQN